MGARTPLDGGPCLAPLFPAPPESRLRRFLGGWLGLAAAAAVLLCHARRRRRRRPELEGEEGRNLISPVAKGWRQTPSSPRAARELGGLRYPEGPSPRADGKWGGAGGRLGKGALWGVRWEAGRSRSHPGQTEGAQCLKGTQAVIRMTSQTQQ